MKNHLKLIVGITALLFLGSTDVNAQGCRAFTKKECRPQVDPYIHNGQMNTAFIAEGEEAELLLTFYGGQDYRLVVCGMETLGDVYFRILDTDRNEVYTSKGKNKNHFDFKVMATQQLLVAVHSVPNEERTVDIGNLGCISVLVGFKSKN